MKAADKDSKAEWYQKNKTRINAKYMEAYRNSYDVRARVLSRTKNYFARNPDAVIRANALKFFVRGGLRRDEVPEDLLLAKMEQYRILKSIKSLGKEIKRAEELAGHNGG